ncbi:uncharacterized protein METZ01_LOCUS146507, partial [marine metagenome]
RSGWPAWSGLASRGVRSWALAFKKVAGFSVSLSSFLMYFAAVIRAPCS